MGCYVGYESNMQSSSQNAPFQIEMFKKERSRSCRSRGQQKRILSEETALYVKLF